MAKIAKTEQEEPLKVKLWKAADKLRKNMDAAEYKHVAINHLTNYSPTTSTPLGALNKNNLSPSEGFSPTLLKIICV